MFVNIVLSNFLFFTDSVHIMSDPETGKITSVDYESEKGQNMTPLDLLNSGSLVKICAPMVRYSK